MAENDLKTPRHIAVIMDGNGRWAARRNRPRVEGHLAGAQRVKDILQYAREFGVEYLTLYAFSTENWKRSAEEVGALMGIRFEEVEETIEKERQLLEKLHALLQLEQS